MATELDRVSSHLAANLEALRKKRHLTQAQLAKLAGVPRSTLTYFESGEGNPSLQNLVKLSTALQVSIEELLAAPRASFKLIKSADIPAASRSQGSVRVFDLLPDPIPGMRIDRMELDVGARLAGVPHVTGTKEYLTCVQGQVSVRIAGGTFECERGDVFAFPGDQPHSYQNTGTARAVCLSVVVISPLGL